MKRYTRQTSDAWTSLGKHEVVLDSTNLALQRELQAAALAGEVLPEGYSIRADFQTLGRGRLGRHWEANAGENLTVSYLLDGSHVHVGQLFTLSQNLALAVRDTIDLLLGEVSQEHVCEVKWPNDIYLDGRKVGGILAESVLNGDQVAYLVAGIGLNVNQVSFDDLTQATSLRLISGLNLRIAAVWESLTRRLQVAHEELRCHLMSGDTYAVTQRYHQHLLGYGAWNRYTYTDSGTRFVARMLGVDARGQLRLEHDGDTFTYDHAQVRWEGASDF